jgi:6-phosphogluconate dehydrogenase (decarboxylating)
MTAVIRPLTADYQDKLLSAMRYGFGGHLEKSAK